MFTAGLQVSDDGVNLSDELCKAIESVIGQGDPLIAADFDLVDYVNKIFPSEQSLVNLDETIAKTIQEIHDIDVEIADIIHAQSSSQRDGQTALAEARLAIQELFEKIKEIKKKTDSSEVMVKEITRDIKQLDYAKRHLTTSITTLNHLHMLVQGVQTLQSLAERRQYGEIASMLPGIINVMEHFENYTEIPQVRELASQVSALRNQLSDQILSEFKDATAGGKAFLPTQQRADACRVANVLDQSVQNEVINFSLDLQLAEYKVLFEDTQDSAWLDKVDQRYHWFKRKLGDFEESLASMYPKEWNMPKRLAKEFCRITREELIKIMNKRSADLKLPVLQAAIKSTHGFEALLARRFPGVLKPPSAEPQTSGQMSPEKSQFISIISQCFEDHTDVFISAQSQNLTLVLNNLCSKYTTKDKSTLPQRHTETSAVVIPSSGDLFLFYKGCMQKAAEFSASDNLLLGLTELFKSGLTDYANRCLSSLIRKGFSVPSNVNFIKSFAKDFESASDSRRLTEDERYLTCCVLGTAEYCAETLDILQEKMRSRLKDQNQQNKIDFVKEKGMFYDVIKNCIQLLVSDLDSACDAALQAMTKMQWSAVGQVGDESGFVLAIKKHTREVVPIVRDYLSKDCRKYFTGFCTSFAQLFESKYINCVYKCRPISELGANQLLLDTQSLKTWLLNLPLVDSNVSRDPPVSYRTLVNKGMEKAEMLLKSVLQSHHSVESFVSNFLRLVPDGDLNEFQKILEMKGIRRSDQSGFVDCFRQKRSSEVGSGAHLSAAGVPPFSAAALRNNAADSDEESGVLRLQKLQRLMKKF